MKSNTSVEAVADAFQKLNTSDQVPKVTQYGIWASWVALVLFAACLAGVVFLVIDSNRRAEEIRLKQTTDLVAQTLESRLLGTAELLQKTSMRLMQGRGDRYPIASAELSAVTLMEERPEVVEISVIDVSGQVVRNWVSPVSPTSVRRSAGGRIEGRSVLGTIGRVNETDTSEITPLYVLDGSSLVFADLIVPTPTPKQVLVARIDITRLLNGVIRYASTDAGFHYDILKDGRPVIDEDNTSPSESALVYSTVLEPLGRRGESLTTLVGYSYEHTLATINRVPVFLVTVLSLLLALTIGWLYYYQRQQHRAHQLLAVEYTLRRAMSESAVMGLRVTDPEGRILYVNETFQKLIGCDASELLNQKPPYSYWLEDVTDRLEETLSSDAATPQPVHFLAKRKSGEIFHAELRLSPLKGRDGEKLGYIGVLYDVTPQQKAHEALMAANDRFTRVVQSIKSALVVLSEDGQLRFANEGYERLFGHDVDAAMRLLGQLEAVPESERREGVYDEATKRWFDVRHQPIIWTRGEAARLVIATDITARRELEIARDEQMRRAESTQRLVTMGEMASSLAHELNQPLAAISNYAGGASTMLASGALTPERAQTALTKIENQAVRAGRIIQRIRSFAKKTDPKLEPVTVQTIIQETMELASIQARKLHGQVKLEIESDLPVLSGDAVMLEQLLLNLIKNALEACAECEDHTVTVRVWREEQAVVRFAVTDHGHGISDEAKTQLFDAFYSTKSAGMGMGLNICRSIAELHGGHLTVSDTPGGGATFSFTVPVCGEGENRS